MYISVIFHKKSTRSSPQVRSIVYKIWINLAWTVATYTGYVLRYRVLFFLLFIAFSTINRTGDIIDVKYSTGFSVGSWSVVNTGSTSPDETPVVFRALFLDTDIGFDRDDDRPTIMFCSPKGALPSVSRRAHNRTKSDPFTVVSRTAYRMNRYRSLVLFTKKDREVFLKETYTYTVWNETKKRPPITFRGFDRNDVLRTFQKPLVGDSVAVNDTFQTDISVKS